MGIDQQPRLSLQSLSDSADRVPQCCNFGSRLMRITVVPVNKLCQLLDDCENKVTNFPNRTLSAIVMNAIRRSPALAAMSILCVLAAILTGCAPRPEAPMQLTKATNIPMTETPVPKDREIATFAGGCFWCTEAIFQDLKGIDKVVSGYTGGKVPNPSYEQVCNGSTGYAEATQITFDPKVITFRDLLHIFFTTHNPTTLNQQGADRGTQYRSGVFYHSEAQKQVAQEVIAEITKERLYDNPIVTEVTGFTNFYSAESYHQNYYKDNPNQGYCSAVIAPKVAKFRDHYRALLKP